MPRRGDGSLDPSTIDTVFRHVRAHGHGRYTDTLRRSDLKRIRGDSNGDVLVIRTKGTAGCPQHLRATLDTLRLRRPGDMRVGYSWDSSFKGQVQKACDAGYVDVIDLGADRAFRWTRAGSGVIKTRESYEDAYGPGEMLVLKGGEYIQVDVSKGELLSVSWSTDLGPAELLQTVVESFGPPHHATNGMVVLEVGGETQTAHGASDDVVDCIVDNPNFVRYYSIDLGDSTVVWTAPRTHLPKSQAVHSEAGISCSIGYATSLVHHLIATTATKELKEASAHEQLTMQLGKAGTRLQL